MSEESVMPFRMVAALYVDPKGCYAGLEGVDTWGPERDARGYDADREHLRRRPARLQPADPLGLVP